MKYFVTVILTVLSFTVVAAMRSEVADLPISDSADTENLKIGLGFILI
jgi:hypothetical protein